ncbi:hypothetical protein EVAR_84094_1 [Eumeta japonica]|uniref:Uncharacterized protein n=1 Tax=Eumeta variegata TaxID=151549 RepID=A0A4C1UYV9_EUMVA|nr:hypothetical protein EVAR_84094_1 [Eumeta japonica]
MKVDKESSGSSPSSAFVSDSKPMLPDRKGSLKVTIASAPHMTTLTHLPQRPPVDLAFTDLTYKVQEGRRSSELKVLKLSPPRRPSEGRGLPSTEVIDATSVHPRQTDSLT